LRGGTQANHSPDTKVSTISCVNQNDFIQYAGLIANAIHTKWKFIVEFEDTETGAIEGTLGEAADRDECELLVQDEMEYQRLRGYIRVTAEAVELCEQCEGEGSIPVEDSIVSICDACGGRIGILSTFKRGRGAEMMSTQSHLRAAS
jgi:hypothetical protein